MNKRPRLHIADGSPDFDTYDRDTESYERHQEELFEMQREDGFVLCPECESQFECLRIQQCKNQK